MKIKLFEHLVKIMTNKQTNGKQLMQNLNNYECLILHHLVAKFYVYHN